MKRSLALFVSLFLSASVVVIAANSKENNAQKRQKTAKTILTQSSSQQPASDSVTSELSPEAQKYLEDIAQNITVRISTQGNGGSGVLIGKQNNSYLVLTNAHVIIGGETFELQTPDGQTHQATLVPNSIGSDDDIVLLQFDSELDYQTATLSQLPVEQGLTTFVGGYSAQTREFLTSSGAVTLLPDRALKDGYQIGYSSDIESGMSGGPILDEEGELIGINGRGSFPILNTGFVYQDGTQPSLEKIEQMRQYSWGVPTNTLLTQMDSNLITAYNLPQPVVLAQVNTPELTGWMGELEATAKQISVRIDNTNGLSNGSGIIIAKEGNTYTVLTADHVICERDNATQPCRDFVYEILTHDGQKHPIAAKTIRRQEGVDLAVIEFNSDEDYQVAQLADYPLTNIDAVFVAGYPKLSNSMSAQWRFSPGLRLDRERGLLNVTDNLLTIDSLGLTISQGSLSGGYEMVYTSITYGGMSGGAVLDREGRVIGIHGLAEGQTAIDTQSSSSKQIQLGYSLGIPVTTFIRLADKFEVASTLPIEKERPAQLSKLKQQNLQEVITSTEIPEGNATAENWLERGNQFWRLRRYKEAVAAFGEVIDLKPEFVHLAHYGKGLALADDKQYELALASLESATTTKPEFAPAYSRKSSILTNLDRLEAALAAVERAISLESDNANLYVRKSWILDTLGKDEEAIIAVTRAIELNPMSIFYFNRGFIYYKQNKMNLASANFEQAIEINPNSTSAYLLQGFAYQQRNPDKALANFEQAIEIDPNSASAYVGRGYVYAQRNPDKALANFEQAIEIDPNSAGAYVGRGVVYAQQGELDKALVDFDKAIEIDPELALSYAGRGFFVYGKQGELDKALADFEQAIEIDPRSDIAYIGRGFYIYQEQGELDKALADYEKAIKINSNSAMAYVGRGIVYEKQGERNKALADFEQAIEINPKLIVAYESRGFVYLQQGELNKALTDFEKMIEIDLNSVNAYYYRGHVYNKRGELDKALTDYSRAIKIKSDYAEAYYYRGRVYNKRGELDKALSDYSRAIEIKSDYTEAYSYRGAIYGDRGELDKALADLEKTIEIKSDYAEAYVALGVIHGKKGNIEAARTNLEKALQLSIEQNNRTLAKKIASILQQLS